jgi:predicted GNAT family acetyltransferase
MQYCLAEPNVNLFILGDIEHFGFENAFQEVWFQTMDGRLSGIALRYHDNLILYSRDLDMAFPEVRDLLETREVRVISGKQAVIDKFHPFVAGHFSKREMIFCELSDPSKLEKGTSEVRVAAPADALEIAEVYGQISEFSGLYASELDARHKQIMNRISSREGMHMFIKQDGRIVSHANSAAETSVSGMIGGILTLPEYRHRGLASKVISAVCQDLARRGKSACLFYDNPQAGAIFQRLGFQVTNKWTILEKGSNE